MQIILHQIKKEWASQRWVFVIWYTLLGVEVFSVGTGFLGGFKSPDSVGVVDNLSELVTLLVAIGVVMIPASLALNDPPTQETAHWQALPIRPWHLLVSKLITMAVYLLLPLCLTHVVTMWLSDALMWSGTSLLDVLSSYPSWMLLGLAFGASSGTWRTFSIVMTLFWSGLMLAIMIVEATSSINGSLMYWLNSTNLEAAIQDSFANSVFLLGSAAVILFRYHTRISGKGLSAVFLICFLITVNFLPQFTRTFVPAYQTEAMIKGNKITIDYALPNQLLSFTNHTNRRIAGRSPYSKLKIEGLDDNYFLMPVTLEATLQVYEQSDPTVRKAFGSRTHFQYFYWTQKSYADQTQENIFALPKLQPDMGAINPIDLNEMDFDLFELDANVLNFIGSSSVDMNTVWWVKPFRFEQVGDLALETGSEFLDHGTTIRLVAWLPDGEDRTQVKLHVRTVEFSRRRNNDIDPRWNVSALRFILIHEQTGEVCFTTTPAISGKVNGLCNVGYHYVILNFAVSDDSNVERPVSADWLKDAKLRVFRFFAGAQTKVNHFMENVRISDLPITPRAEPTDGVNW